MSSSLYRLLLFRNARAFSTSQSLARGPVELAKDALKTVDKAASQAAIKGLDAGENVVNAVKDTASKMAGKSQDAVEHAKHTTPSQMVHEAKGQANEKTSELSGKTSELAGKAKGKLSELEGKAKKETRY